MLALPKDPRSTRASSGSHNSKDFKRLSSVIAETVANTKPVALSDCESIDEEPTHAVEADVENPLPHAPAGNPLPQAPASTKEKSWWKTWMTVVVGSLVLAIIIVIVVCCRPKKQPTDDDLKSSPANVDIVQVPGLKDRPQTENYIKTIEFDSDWKQCGFEYLELRSSKDKEVGQQFVKKVTGSQMIEKGVQKHWMILKVNGEKVRDAKDLAMKLSDGTTGALHEDIVKKMDGHSARQTDHEPKTITITFNTYIPDMGQTCDKGHKMERVAMKNDDDVQRFMEEHYTITSWNDEHFSQTTNPRYKGYCKKHFGPQKDEKNYDAAKAFAEYQKSKKTHKYLTFSAVCDCCQKGDLTVVYHCFECGKLHKRMYDKCSSCYKSQTNFPLGSS